MVATEGAKSVAALQAAVIAAHPTNAVTAPMVLAGIDIAAIDAAAAAKKAGAAEEEAAKKSAEAAAAEEPAATEAAASDGEQSVVPVADQLSLAVAGAAVWDESDTEVSVWGVWGMVCLQC